MLKRSSEIGWPPTPTRTRSDRAEEAHVLDGAVAAWRRGRGPAGAPGPAGAGPARRRRRPGRAPVRFRVTRWPPISRAPDGGVGDAGADDVEGADEGGDEGGGGVVVDGEGVADLLGHALVHHHDAVGHRQRLLLVVGDVDGGDAERLLDGADLLAQRHADLGVERRERLVEEQELGLRGERARQRHALLLAAGELEGIAAAVLRQLDEPQHLGDARVALGARATPATFSPKATFSATVRFGKSA